MQLEFKQEVQHQSVLQLETSTTSVLGQQTPLPYTTRQQSIDSVNGLILNTIDLDSRIWSKRWCCNLPGTECCL